jgi:hypothetical protein
MDPRLQAGVELMIEKTAAEAAGVGLLAGSLQKKAARMGITKRAQEEQGVEQEHKSENLTPSSGKGKKMENKNQDYGKSSDYKLDDDPSKGQSAMATGDTVNSFAGKNITTEGSGMPDLTMKKASANRRILATMLRSQI